MYVYASQGDIPTFQTERQKRRLGEEKTKEKAAEAPKKGEAPAPDVPKEAPVKTADAPVKESKEKKTKEKTE